MTPFSFTVPGVPVPWQRTALVGGRPVTPAKQRAYQQKVRLHALGGCPASLRAALAADPRVVWIVALLVAVPDLRKRDTDNVQKTIGDALNGAIWLDDSQIVEWHVRRVLDAERPRVDVVAVARSHAPAPWTVARMIETLDPSANRVAA